MRMWIQHICLAALAFQQALGVLYSNHTSISRESTSGPQPADTSRTANLPPTTSNVASASSSTASSATNTALSVSSTKNHRINETVSATKTGPANGTITAAPTCPPSFVFSRADQATICLNCPQANGTWLQSIPHNTCSVCSGTEWVFTENCYVHAGTVSLTYFATATGNGSHDASLSTYYDPIQDFTYTSPSVYFRLNTLYATNACGALGPTATDAIFAFDLINVTTLLPTPPGVTTAYRKYDTLKLSDLADNCPSTKPTPEEAKSYMDNDVNRCNPRLAWPLMFKQFGYPYWKHCNVHLNKYGVYDPPRALTAAASVALPTLPHTVSAISPTAVTRLSAGLGQASKTSSPIRLTAAPSEAKPTSPQMIATTPQSDAGPSIAVADSKDSIKSNEANDPTNSDDDSSTLVKSSASADIASWIAAGVSAVKDSTAIGPSASSQQSSKADRVTKMDSPDPMSGGQGVQIPETEADTQPQAVLTIGGNVVTAKTSGDAVIIAGPSTTATIASGASLDVGGQIASGASNGLVVGGSSTALYSAAAASAASFEHDPVDSAIASITAAGEVLSISSTGGDIILHGPSTSVTVRSGETATIAGQVFQVDASTRLIRVSPTSDLSSLDQTQTSSQAIVTGTYGKKFTAMHKDGSFVLHDGPTTFELQAGNTATIAGQTVIAAAGGDLSVGGSTVRFSATQTQDPAKEIITGTDGRSLTLVSLGAGSFVVEDDSTTFTIRKGDATTFAGRTISAASSGLLVGTSVLDFVAPSISSSSATETIVAYGGVFDIEQVGTSAFVLENQSTTVTLSKGQLTVLEGQTISVGLDSTGTSGMVGGLSGAGTSVGTLTAASTSTLSSSDDFVSGSQSGVSSAPSPICFTLLISAALVFGLFGLATGL